MANVARFLFGLCFLLGGIALGLYVGVWLCFLGGFVDLVVACKADIVSRLDVGIGLFWMTIAGPAGWLSGFIPAAIGCLLLGVKRNPRAKLARHMQKLR